MQSIILSSNQHMLQIQRRPSRVYKQFATYRRRDNWFLFSTVHLDSEHRDPSSDHRLQDSRQQGVCSWGAHLNSGTASERPQVSERFLCDTAAMLLTLRDRTLAVFAGLLLEALRLGELLALCLEVLRLSVAHHGLLAQSGAAEHGSRPTASSMVTMPTSVLERETMLVDIAEIHGDNSHGSRCLCHYLH